MPTYTDARRNALAYASASVRLETLEIHRPSWASPLRWVIDYQSLTATLEASAPRDAGLTVVFDAGQFDVQPPQIDDSGTVRMDITIDGASGVIDQLMRQEDWRDGATSLIHREWSLDDLSAPIFFDHLTVKTVARSYASVRIQCRYRSHTDRAFPGRLLERSECKGLL